MLRLLTGVLTVAAVFFAGCGTPASEAMAGEPVTTTQSDPSPTVEVDGRLMVVNGQAEVPRGLFGVHAYKLTPERNREYGIECIRQIHFSPGSGVAALGKDGKVKDAYKDLSVVIDCMGDRYRPATVLSNKDYEAFFRKIGRAYATKVKQAGIDGYVEFWNEPYLNWANRSYGSGRNHYNNKWYDLSKAREGGPVTIKGWDKPLKHLKWKKLWPKGEDGKIGWGVKIPEGLEAGDTFKASNSYYWTNNRKQTFTVVEEWHVHDPTQVSWWSGRQNLDFYLWMFEPFARSVKAVDPNIQVLAGWDFGLSHGDWAVWRELYKPILDLDIDLVDGITDHHYGVNSRIVPAWYEVACAYAVTEHGKWIRGYNTECDGQLDPAVHRSGGGKSGAAGAATYMLRDILELCYHSPAKSGSRTTHHPGTGEMTVLKYLKDLRGPMVRAVSRDVDLWPTASVHGDKLVVVVFNNAGRARQLKLKLAAPKGTTFKPGRVEQIEMTGSLKIAGEKLDASGTSATLTRKLLSRQAVKIVLPLEGNVPAKPAVRRKQHFARGVLQKVQPGKGKTFTIAVDQADLASADAAWLKIILEGNDAGEARVTLNGRSVTIPDRNYTLMLPVSPGDLKTRNTLVFTADGEKSDGFQVDIASLVVDSRSGD